MMNFETIIKSLSNSKKYISIEKRGDGRYAIYTCLYLINSSNMFPIYLVEINNKFYFADYGSTLRDLEIEFNEVDLKIQQLVKQKLKNIGLFFDEMALLIEIKENQETESLNRMICAMSFLQTVF